jgi:ubiquinone/menaquinone biosynthesis C-methylase UbiE
MRSSRLPYLGFVIAMCCVSHLLAYADEKPNTPSKRKPAAVMGHEGAEWLERPERIQEERPDEVVAAMELKNGDVVADIGCGSGFFTWRLAKAVGPKGKVYGEDIQPEMLELLKQRCEHEKITNIEPVLGKEDDPLLAKESVDWILLVDVYHEFQQPEIMLKKMRDALKVSGRVALVEYRLLGETAKHIKEEHRMSVKQVLAEWHPAGFELVDLLEFLPSQHLFIFKKRAEK